MASDKDKIAQGYAGELSAGSSLSGYDIPEVAGLMAKLRAGISSISGHIPDTTNVSFAANYSPAQSGQLTVS
jgi:hypothetical protein